MKQNEWGLKEGLFFEDLIATIDGVLCGQIKKSHATRWINKSGYTFNWKTHELFENSNKGVE